MHNEKNNFDTDQVLSGLGGGDMKQLTPKQRAKELNCPVCADTHGSDRQNVVAHKQWGIYCKTCCHVFERPPRKKSKTRRREARLAQQNR